MNGNVWKYYAYLHLSYVIIVTFNIFIAFLTPFFSHVYIEIVEKLTYIELVVGKDRFTIYIYI